MDQVISTALAATQNATSTSHNVAVAWPYILFSIFIILGLIGTAHRILSNQND
jgi:hypothetical protein